MARHLNIYDPVRIELLNDITHRLIDKDEECTYQMRLEAMSCIGTLRNLIRDLAPAGTAMQRIVRSRLTPDDYKMVYWEEYAQEEYRKIVKANKDAEHAIAWIGA